MIQLSLLCFFLAAKATAADSYQFTDPEFNSLLDDQLLDFSSGKRWSTSSRTKRELDDNSDGEDMLGVQENMSAKDMDENNSGQQRCRHHHHMKSCCGSHPMAISLLYAKRKEDATFGRDCFMEVMDKMGNKSNDNGNFMDMYSCERVNKMKKRHVCIQECLAKKLGLANEEGSVDFSKVRSFLASQAKEGWQKDIAEKSVDKCSELKFDVMWKEDPVEYKCNPQVLQLKHCLWRQMLKNCPEDQQKKDPFCLRLREKLGKDED